MKIWKLLGVLSILPVSACTFTPQKVTLQPQVQVSSSNIGNGQIIYLKTLDERTSSAIGTRGISGFGAEITSNDDVASIVHSEISKNLEKQGFEVSNNNIGTTTLLRAEIRNLEYNLTPGILTGTLRAEAAIKGICVTNKERNYEHLYRGESEEQVFVVQFAEENAVHINNSLSTVIQKMFQDSELLNCLKTAKLN